MNRTYLIIGTVVLVVFILLGTLTPIVSKKRTVALVEKAQGEMRSLATAIFDLNTALIHASREGVIASSEGPSDSAREKPKESLEEFRFGEVEEIFPNLLDPIQAVESIPHDPFSSEGKGYLVASWGSVFLILSLGPNGELDVTPADLEDAMNLGADLTLAELVRVRWSYSPTNGAYSNGDLIRFVQ